MFSRFSSSTFKINVCLKKEISRAIRLIIPVCSVCYSLASFAYHKLISCSRQLSGFCLIFGDKWWFLCAGHQYIIRIFIHAKGRIFDWLTRRVTWNFVIISCVDQWFFLFRVNKFIGCSFFWEHFQLGFFFFFLSGNKYGYCKWTRVSFIHWIM